MDRHRRAFCLWAFWIWALTADGASVDRSIATTMVNGWLAESQNHLDAKPHQQIRSSETIAGLHVFHLHPEGFIVASGDDECEPVLAFSDRGDLRYDPENPLWLLLERHNSARLEQHHRAEVNRANLTKAALTKTTQSSKLDDQIFEAGREANAKWGRYRAAGARTPGRHQFSGTPVLFNPQITSTTNYVGSFPTGIAPTNYVPIREFQLIGGHAFIAHEARESVSVYSSCDAGQTWQLEDSGIIWPTWTSKRPVREAGCWYRLAIDGVYDELAVSLMRTPAAAIAPEETVIDFAPDPGGGFVGSAGTVSDIRVAPLVKSTWSQSTARGVNCYNYFTPNNYVDGCVATALAQVLRYWQYPSMGIGRITRTVYVNGSAQSATTRGGDGAGGAYDWSAMPLSPSAVNYVAAQWQMVGALCYDAGVSVNMQYSSGGSGAYMYLCAGAFTSVFQFSNAKYINYPGNIILPTDSNLAAGHPVLFGISSSGASGHAIICDGFGYDGGTLYHHINFGWDGAYNAWYALPNLETPYNFNRVDTIIYNIFPTGTGELLTGRVTTPQAVPICGATIMATANGQSYSSTSDAKGYYGIKVPSARTYTVTATKTGMSSSTRSNVAIGTSGTSSSGNALGIDFTLANNFTFTAVALAGSVSLRWSAPTNSGLPNNKVYLCQRTDRYPNSVNDGTLVYSGTAQAFEHTGVDNSGSVTNYYAIWGDDGVGSTSLGNNTSVTGLADPGKLRLFWTRNSGEVYTWNLRSSGAKKSAAFVYSGLVDLNNWKLAGLADIDGDGVSDVLWCRTSGEVVYWLLNADGTLKTSGYVTSGNATRSGYYSVAGFNDINGDGSADILWVGAGGEVGYWLLNPSGTLKSAGAITPGNATRSGYYSVAGLRDINGDGSADILWIGAGGEVGYWLLNASGTLKSAGAVTAGNATRSGYYTVAGFEDINGDGAADVLWSGAGGEVGYWLLNTNGTLKSSGAVTPTKLSPAGYWKAAGFRDINGDHTADIIWRGQGGETRYWLLNANGTLNSNGVVDATPVAPANWTLRGVGSTGP